MSLASAVLERAEYALLDRDLFGTSSVGGYLAIRRSRSCTGWRSARVLPLVIAGDRVPLVNRFHYCE